MAQWAAIFGGGRDRDEDGGGMLGLLVMAIVAPLAALLIQMAISRSREYDADKGGAAMSGNPLYLANALRKLESANRQLPMQEATPASAHMFIVNPLSGGGLASLFSTHPPYGRTGQEAGRNGVWPPFLIDSALLHSPPCYVRGPSLPRVPGKYLARNLSRNKSRSFGVPSD